MRLLVAIYMRVYTLGKIQLSHDFNELAQVAGLSEAGVSYFSAKSTLQNGENKMQQR